MYRYKKVAHKAQIENHDYIFYIKMLVHVISC